MNEEQLLKERKEKIISFLKEKYLWLTYLALAFIIWLSAYIRTRNLSGLRDITTGQWTLGPDLDPFLFLRWAKDIVAHGSLSLIDTMRYVPLGFNTREELLLHPHMIAWFYKITTALGFSYSVEQAAALYPVPVFMVTMLFFFLFTRKVFTDSVGKLKSNLIALTASLFFAVMPSILPRTIAGIPEKESSGFMFLFIAFYLFLTAWKSKSKISQIVFACLAGLATAGMALVWGGFIYIMLTLGISLIFAYLLNQIDKNKLLISVIWIAVSFFVMDISSTRYPLSSLLSSTTTLIPLAVITMAAIHFIITETKLKTYFDRPSLSKIPKPLVSIAATIILGVILGSIVFGPGFIVDKIGDITKPLITPITGRLGVTVAENRQPFFSEWESSFGPQFYGIALFFWLFFVGSVYLYYKMTSIFEKRERIFLTIAYVYFLVAIIFSRYAENSVFNGTNVISLLFYLSGAIALLYSFGYYYWTYYKNGEQEKLKQIDFGRIMLFSLFFFSIVSARGSVRTIMVLDPPTAIIVGFFIIGVIYEALALKDSSNKIIGFIVAGLVIVTAIYSGYYLYNVSYSTAQGYIPSEYTHQWQQAMSWVRENTPENAVFAHWWDYGYWLQSIGNRATVLDGGNAIVYWDYLMGRYALTGSSNQESLDFLYSHNTTHFLIDSTDIGKYAAFSSIGSDINGDRYSWISTFAKNPAQTKETKNSTQYVYQGGTVLDQDIVFEENGTRVFLPGKSAGIGAVVLDFDSVGNLVNQPIGIFVYQNKQYPLPLRYAYNSQFIDFGSGLEAGVFIMPYVSQAPQSGITIDQTGALLYLSSRTVKSQLARLYLYNENNPNFKLVHSEDDPCLISTLKNSNATLSDFALDGTVCANARGNSFAGPIRIWQINYPAGMQVNQTYLQTSYQDSRLESSL